MSTFGLPTEREMNILKRAQQKAAKMVKGARGSPILRKAERAGAAWRREGLGDLVSVCKYLKGRCKEGWSQAVFSVCLLPMHMQYRRFSLNVRNIRVTEHWQRLVRKLVEPQSLEKFRSHWDMVLGNHL